MVLHYIPKTELDRAIHENDLAVLGALLRINALYMIQQAGSGHIGSAFSAMDIMVDLFFREMEPDDIFISSKGHDCAALYSILIAKGVIPFDEIHNFRRLGGLPGHPEITWPGIHANTGLLGMGLSKARGIALARKMKGEPGTVYVLLGDGELQEGQIYEASMKGYPDNLRAFVDYNGQQCDGALHYDEQVKLMLSKPSTKKGQSVSFMEKASNEELNPYHSGPLNDMEYAIAFTELHMKAPGYYFETVERIPKPPFNQKANPFIEPYGKALVELAKKDERIVALDADLLTDCGLVEFKRLFPERFIECGIAEQDMVSTAGGLALVGMIPVVHSFAAFLCRRANEQIYNNCGEGKKIIYVGSLAGRLPPGPGPSHECTEDIALMRTMSGMEILEPRTGSDIEDALAWALYKIPGPVYIRLACLPGMEGMRR